MKAMEDLLWEEGVLTSDIELDTVLDVDSNPQVVQKFAKAMAYLEDFTKLNPDLASIQFHKNDWKALRGVLHGVVSGFNIDDIEVWANGVRNNAEKAKLMHRIIQQFSKPEMLDSANCPRGLRQCFLDAAGENFSIINWIPCSKTIENIQAQLDSKYGAIPKLGL